MNIFKVIFINKLHLYNILSGYNFLFFMYKYVYIYFFKKGNLFRTKIVSDGINFGIQHNVLIFISCIILKNTE